jgi:hypothetical protein
MSAALACYVCTEPIKPKDVVNQHHFIYKSRGGTETAPTHKACHVHLHSSRNDFREWGRLGGLECARRGWWIFNLKRGKNPPDPLRYIPFGR